MSKSSLSANFNFIQRIIQAVFGTREVAIVALISFCIMVEIGILYATQQYESITAPKGSLLFWGMSAAGMVVFFAELLKLPVAWVNGVISGRSRHILTAVTAGLCLLTAMTIKDLTIREWDLALAPSREVQTKAEVLRAEISSLEKKRIRLSENSKESQVDLTARIAETNKSLDIAQDRKRKEMDLYAVALKTLNQALLDGPTRERIKRLEEERDQEQKIIDEDIKKLEDQRKAIFDKDEKDATTEAGSKAEEDKVAFARYEKLFAQYNLDKKDYEKRRKEYENARKEVERNRDSAIKELGPDSPFTGVGPERERIKQVAKNELDRLEKTFEALPVPVAPLDPKTKTPDIKPKDSVLTPELINKKIEQKQIDRDQSRTDKNEEIKAIEDDANKPSIDEENKLEEKRKELKKDHDSLIDKYDSQITKLIDEENALTRQRGISNLSQPEKDKEIQDITKQIPILTIEVEKLEGESTRLAKDTNPIRAANGLIRWFLPGSTPQHQEEIAYGVFPIIIALLVASLPAILLELSVYSLRPEIITRVNRKQSMIIRLITHRKALQLLRRRAKESLANAESKLRENELKHQLLLSEHEKRTNEVDREVDSKTLSNCTNIQRECDEHIRTIAEGRDRESKIGIQLAELTINLVKLSEDNTRLATRVIDLDASFRPHV